MALHANGVLALSSERQAPEIRRVTELPDAKYEGALLHLVEPEVASGVRLHAMIARARPDHFGPNDRLVEVIDYDAGISQDRSTFANAHRIEHARQRIHRDRNPSFGRRHVDLDLCRREADPPEFQLIVARAQRRNHELAVLVRHQASVAGNELHLHKRNGSIVFVLDPPADRVLRTGVNAQHEQQRSRYYACQDCALKSTLHGAPCRDAPPTPHFTQRSRTPTGDTVVGFCGGNALLIRSTDPHRPQNPGEELANSVSHGVGFLAAVASIPILVIGALNDGAAAVVGAAIFGATMTLLYLTSTLYHAMAPNRAKRVFQILDHSAIYLLIAGTYTPFTLGVLRGAWGWSLFGVIWGLAVIGIFLKGVRGICYPRLSTAVYLMLVWLVLIALKPLAVNVPASGLFWLVAGGVAYTAGVGFYAA